MLRLMMDGDDFYNVTFTVADVSLREEYDTCAEYAMTIHGEIWTTKETEDGDMSNDHRLIGEISARLFRLIDATNDGVDPSSFHDIFDCDENSEHLFYAVCTQRGYYSEAVQNRFEMYGMYNVLGITFVGVHPEYRGRGVAQAAVKRLCQVFGGDAIVAVQSFPMHYPSAIRNAVDVRTEESEAKLLRFWKRCGFVQSPCSAAKRTGMKLLVAMADTLSRQGKDDRRRS